MDRKAEKQDRITTWLQRSYYLLAITNELDLFAWVKAAVIQFVDS